MGNFNVIKQVKCPYCGFTSSAKIKVKEGTLSGTILHSCSDYEDGGCAKMFVVEYSLDMHCVLKKIEGE